MREVRIQEARRLIRDATRGMVVPGLDPPRRAQLAKAREDAIALLESLDPQFVDSRELAVRSTELFCDLDQHDDPEAAPGALIAFVAARATGVSMVLRGGAVIDPVEAGVEWELRIAGREVIDEWWAELARLPDETSIAVWSQQVRKRYAAGEYAIRLTRPRAGSAELEEHRAAMVSVTFGLAEAAARHLVLRVEKVGPATVPMPITLEEAVKLESQLAMVGLPVRIVPRKAATRGRH